MFMQMKIRILPTRILIEEQIWLRFSTEIVSKVVERIALKLFFFALNIVYECHVFKLHLIWFSHTQKTTTTA